MHELHDDVQRLGLNEAAADAFADALSAAACDAAADLPRVACPNCGDLLNMSRFPDWQECHECDAVWWVDALFEQDTFVGVVVATYPITARKE